jgi:uncharacterized membrane protein YfcA
MKRIIGLLVLVFVLVMSFPHIALAQDTFPTVPDSTVSTVQLWMIAFGILTTVIASLMRLLPVQDLPDLTKKCIVVVISLILAAVGLAVQNDLFPEVYVKAFLTILIVASGIYSLLGRSIQNSMAGVKTISVTNDAAGKQAVAKMAAQGVVADPGH